jgi:hypothetical protein
VNELFSSNSILIHYANFNARAGSCRPVYAEDSYPAPSDPFGDNAIILPRHGDQEAIGLHGIDRDNVDYMEEELYEENEQ